jgi:hypothetical protein
MIGKVLYELHLFGACWIKCFQADVIIILFCVTSFCCLFYLHFTSEILLYTTSPVFSHVLHLLLNIANHCINIGIPSAFCTISLLCLDILVSIIMHYLQFLLQAFFWYAYFLEQLRIPVMFLKDFNFL